MYFSLYYYMYSVLYNYFFLCKYGNKIIDFVFEQLYVFYIYLYYNFVIFFDLYK